MKWYESKSCNDQGLVIDEETGENIAVSYKKENAALIAAAPEMRHILKHIITLQQWGELPAIPKEIVRKAETIIDSLEAAA